MILEIHGFPQKNSPIIDQVVAAPFQEIPGLYCLCFFMSSVKYSEIIKKESGDVWAFPISSEF